jgi:hypothetical protein
VGDNNNVSGSQHKIWSRSQHPWNSGGVHSFNETLSGVRIEEAPHANKDSSVITILFLFLMDVIQMLVEETKKYYNQNLDALDKDTRCSGLPNVTTGDIFLAIIIQMVYDKQDILKVGFEVLTAVSTKMADFWVVAPCSLVDVY